MARIFRLIPPRRLTECSEYIIRLTLSLTRYYVCGNISLVSKMCGRGGTADALASGASGGNLVVVQIHSTAPFNN